ncbi:hypothetical protein [Pseudomonas taiwanensis]|nr:hypothetical protein [Pseudomonas taiwanensis]MBC3489500.1 hypothetical protein [Pseudomonas taiwanensis]
MKTTYIFHDGQVPLRQRSSLAMADQAVGLVRIEGIVIFSSQASND